MKKHWVAAGLTACLALGLTMGLTGCMNRAQRTVAQEREEAARQLAEQYLTDHYGGGEVRKCACLTTQTEDGTYAQNTVIAQVYAKDTAFRVCVELGGELCYDDFSRDAITASLEEYIPTLLKANGTLKQCEIAYYPLDNDKLSTQRMGFAPYGITDAETLLQNERMYVDVVLSYQNLELGEVGRWDYPALDVLQDTSNLDVCVLNFMPGRWEEKYWLKHTRLQLTDKDAQALLRDEVVAFASAEMKYTVWN